MHANTRTVLWKTSCLGFALVGVLYGSPAVVWSADEAPAEPKSIRKTCGKCPDGYATTGVTQSPENLQRWRSDVRPVCPARGEHAVGLRVLPGGIPRDRQFVRAISLRKPRRRTAVAVSIGADGAQSSRSDSRWESLSAGLRRYAGSGPRRLAAAAENVPAGTETVTKCARRPEPSCPNESLMRS